MTDTVRILIPLLPGEEPVAYTIPGTDHFTLIDTVTIGTVSGGAAPPPVSIVARYSDSGGLTAVLTLGLAWGVDFGDVDGLAVALTLGANLIVAIADDTGMSATLTVENVVLPPPIQTVVISLGL